MNENYYQGYLDSLCGIYSILNADKLVNNTPETESQYIFNFIIETLDESGILKDVILEGSDHKVMTNLIRSLTPQFPLQITNKRGIMKINEWWNYSKKFLDERENRTIILSLGGKVYHLTVIERMTDRTIYCKDSSKGWKTLKKSMCRLAGYPENDKYIIYPSQCWYLGKEL